MGPWEVPGTTEILKVAGKFDERWIPPEARERGSLVHQLTEKHDLGLVDLETVEGPLRGYCLAYLRFLDEDRPRYTRVEEGVVHKGLGFATIIDRVGTCLGARCCFNIKTGAFHHAHEIQAAGEILALDGTRSTRRKRATLYLKKTGKYDLEWHDNGRDFDEFLEALDGWRSQCHRPERHGPRSSLSPISNRRGRWRFE